MAASAPDGETGQPEAPNRRSQLKSDRRLQLLSAAERLIAERGFLAVRLEDIGAAAGVSGPAIYRHFPNKESLLVELLVGISAQLLSGARAVTDRNADAGATLDGLIDFHLDFALGEPDLIRIQDRDLAHLPAPAERQVRKAQRQYVEIWVGVLRELNPELAEADARLMAHAAFGLLNSTPHSMKSVGSKPLILFSLTAILAAGLAMLVLSGPVTFWVCGLLLCLFIGPSQSSARALLLRMAQPGKEGVAFGLYTMTGRAASFIAPWLFSLFVDVFNADRAGLGGIFVVLLAGLFAMFFVRVPSQRGASQMVKP